MLLKNKAFWIKCAWMMTSFALASLVTTQETERSKPEISAKTIKTVKQKSMPDAPKVAERENSEAATGKVFVPSEKISEDFAVPFPADI